MESTTTKIPARWVTGSAAHRRMHGPAEALAQAWIDAGRPHDYQTFRKGYEACAAELGKATAGPKELVVELQVCGRLLFIAHQQMSTQQRAMYARNAHKEGVDVGADDIRGAERAAVLARFGGTT